MQDLKVSGDHRTGDDSSSESCLFQFPPKIIMYKKLSGKRKTRKNEQAKQTIRCIKFAVVEYVPIK